MMGSAVHPSEAFDVHNDIFSTPIGIYSTPCEAPDLHDRIADHLMADAVHPSEAPEVHPSVVPDVR